MQEKKICQSSDISRLVLGTVNGPWKRPITAECLADCLRSGIVAEWLPHLAMLFTEVQPHLVLAFAVQQCISHAEIAATYTAVRAATGERAPNLEDALGL